MFRRSRLSIEPYLTRLYGYAFSLTKDEDRANDLVQETALKALGAKNIPMDSAAYRAWLFRILRNASIDRIRRNKLEPIEIEELDIHSVDEYWCHEEDLINALTVKQSFDRLPNSQREIIALVNIVGMTYLEVGSVLEIAPGTVKSRLSRARRALIALMMEDSSNKLTLKVRQKIK